MKNTALRYGPILWVPFFVLADQVSKFWVRASLNYGEAIPVIPGWFRLMHAQNTGAAFSFAGGWHDSIRLPFLIGVSSIVTLAFLITYPKIPRKERMMRWAVACIVAGALGNLIDRIAFGQVTDFLDAYISSGPLWEFLVRRRWMTHWPTFNIADICVFVGAGLYLWNSVLVAQSEKKQAAAQAETVEPA